MFWHLSCWCHCQLHERGLSSSSSAIRMPSFPRWAPGVPPSSTHNLTAVCWERPKIQMFEFFKCFIDYVLICNSLPLTCADLDLEVKSNHIYIKEIKGTWIPRSRGIRVRKHKLAPLDQLRPFQLIWWGVKVK